MGAHAFLNAFAFRVPRFCLCIPPFLDFAFAFPRSYTQFLSSNSKICVPVLRRRSKFCFTFLFHVPPQKIFLSAYILRAFQRIKITLPAHIFGYTVVSRCFATPPPLYLGRAADGQPSVFVCVCVWGGIVSCDFVTPTPHPHPFILFTHAHHTHSRHTHSTHTLTPYR